jgi:hypothetical protein
MKMSEVTITDLKNYSHVYHIEDDTLFDAILIACKLHIQNYTGLSTDAMDEREDLVIALLVLASEMYDNRSYMVDSAKPNLVIKAILDCHSINLL